MAQLDFLVESANVEKPSATPNASALDVHSVEEWKRINLNSPYLRNLFDQIIRTGYTIEPKGLFGAAHTLQPQKRGWL